MRALALAVGVAALAACAGGEKHASPEEVVRAWSRALNAGDNAAAGKLFARGARIEQAGVRLTVRTQADAVVWNRSLPCSGRIVALEVDGASATATFVLGDRPTSRCDGPGARVAALFRVRDGKIVLFRQLPSDAVPSDQV